MLRYLYFSLVKMYNNWMIKNQNSRLLIDVINLLNDITFTIIYLFGKKTNISVFGQKAIFGFAVPPGY